MRVFFSLALLASLVMNAWALTTDEMGQHLIRLLNRGFTQDLLTDEEERTLIRIIFKCAVDYIPNATYTTSATRKEACRDLARGLYQARTGIDPSVGAVSDPSSAKHVYRNHWLTEQAEIAGASVAAVEDAN